MKSVLHVLIDVSFLRKDAVNLGMMEVMQENELQSDGASWLTYDFCEGGLGATVTWVGLARSAALSYVHASTGACLLTSDYRRVYVGDVDCYHDILSSAATCGRIHCCCCRGSNHPVAAFDHWHGLVCVHRLLHAVFGGSRDSADSLLPTHRQSVLLARVCDIVCPRSLLGGA
jgi:hypothetical protein